MISTLICSKHVVEIVFSQRWAPREMHSSTCILSSCTTRWYDVTVKSLVLGWNSARWSINKENLWLGRSSEHWCVVWCGRSESNTCFDFSNQKKSFCLAVWSYPVFSKRGSVLMVLLLWATASSKTVVVSHPLDRVSSQHYFIRLPWYVWFPGDCVILW
jgi:hypothetical protein